ncbi:MAG: SDR family oxidoreductase [Gammaproteobacteria bacterium]
MYLNAKRVLLTGANGGIGSELARALAAEGCTLVLAGLDEPGLQTLAAELSAKTEAVAIAADLSTPEGINTLAAQASSAFGGIDVLINSAGALDFKRFDQTDPARIALVIQLNLTAPMLLTRALVGDLDGEGKAVVNIGSTLGAIGMPYYSAYSASKAGLQRFSEALRRELGSGGPRILHIAPRATDTGINNSAAQAMHKATKTHVDSPQWVAAQIIKALKDGTEERYLGFPESFFVRLNALLPAVVGKTLSQQARDNADLLAEVR